MNEEIAFTMLKHFMFKIGIRRQYKPDMVALQVSFSQSSVLDHSKIKHQQGHVFFIRWVTGSTDLLLRNLKI